MSQIGAIAGHHRRQHHGIILAQAQRRWQISHDRWQRQQPRGRSVLQPAHSAREKRTRRLAEPVYVVNCHRRCRCNSLVQQIIRPAPNALIVIGFWRKQANHRSDALAASERLHEAVLRIHRCACRCGPAHREPHTACCWRLHIALVVYHFKGRHAQIDPLRRRGCRGLVDILLQLGADRPRVHDGPFNGSRQTVGKRG